MSNIFFDIGIIIVVATMFAYVARFFKQPLIPAYVLTGLVIGPWMNIITDRDTVLLLAEIGIAFLLFIVGLEINFKKLKDVGLVAPLGGSIQVLIIFSFGFISGSFMGFSVIESVYLGLIIAFGSTMIVLKLLSDKRVLETLHGRIIVGRLLTEDFWAILALTILPTLGAMHAGVVLLSLGKAIGVVIVAIICSKYIFPYAFGFAAKSQELLFLLSISVCFVFAMAFSYIGFSIIIGAFIAGVTLAHLPYNLQIIGKVKSIRDFFSTIFFVSLGMQIVLSYANSIIVPLVIFFIFVVIIKPFITMFLTAFFGYPKRIAFLTGLSSAQTSEFGLIIVAQGLILGHIGNNIFTLAVLLAIGTISVTSYTIKYDSLIYRHFKNKLKVFDIFAARADLELTSKKKVEVILCGHNRIGFTISRTLERMKKGLFVVDYNPEMIRNMISRGTPCLYGDIGDSEVLDRLPFKEATMLISTVPSATDNLMLLKIARARNKKLSIFVTASQIEEALKLYDAGADYVILPHFLGGEHVSLLVEDFTKNVSAIIKTKLKHIDELKHRQSIGHEHPRHHDGH